MTALRFPLVCFDLDGTLVDDTIYIWKTLHEAFETDEPARRKAYDDFFGGIISYRDWFEHDLKLLRLAGATKKRVEELLRTLRPMEGAKEAIATLKARGHKVAIISGSLDIVVDHLFGQHLFDHVLINKLHYSPDGQIDGGEPTPYDLVGKAEGLRELARREGLSPDQVAFVGDNENDIWIAQAAGRAIAFNCKSDKLRELCHVEIKTKDLRLVLEHL
ncbi:MAG: HAD family phosphatase [Myxococcota bacterium]|jgi:phosphoserine phosphatase|nr:HAD family phosphatase [Myxococcota bacterium]